MQLNNPSDMMAFQILGTFSTYIPTQICAFFYSLSYYVSYLHFNNMNSFYQCTALIIPTLTTLLQLKYQGTDETTTPFTTHPTTMLVIVLGSTINYLTYVAVLHCPPRRFGVAARLCLALSGYASVASLAALLLPDSVRAYVYSIFVLVSAAEGVDFEACRRRINRFLNHLCRVATNPNWRQSQILPV